MPDYQILYWRHIPAQVRVFDGRRPLARQLPPRFQVTIDRVAMDQGLAGTDDYLTQWQWTEKQQRDGDPAQMLDTIVQELIDEYDRTQSS
jgi:hypothetical protein